MCKTTRQLAIMHTWVEELELLFVEDWQALHRLGALCQAQELHVGGTVEQSAQCVQTALHMDMSMRPHDKRIHEQHWPKSH